MGNTQSSFNREGDGTGKWPPNQSDARPRIRAAGASGSETEAVVTTHQPGHLYSHTLSLDSASEIARDQSRPLSPDAELKAIVAGSQFARYGASDTSLIEPATTPSDADSSSLSCGDSGGMRESSLERSEILQRRTPGLNLEVNTNHEDHPSLQTSHEVETPRGTTSESSARTPRQSTNKEERMASLAKRHSVLLSDDVQVTDTPRVESKEPDSDDESLQSSRKSKLKSLPSYLKIPTAIPRSFTSSKIAIDHKTGSLIDVNRTPDSKQHRQKSSINKAQPEDQALQEADSKPTRLLRTWTMPHRLSSFSNKNALLDVQMDAIPDLSTLSDGTPTPTTPQTPNTLLTSVNLMWRGRGKHVYVTGTFADEWQSKIPLRQLRPHTPFLCTVYLPPGTHRLKFIVDDRWRVSPDLDTATDGDGTLVNYVKIPNLHDESRNSMMRSNVERDETWKRAMAELKSAQVSPRGEWDELNDELPSSAETTWTKDVPACVELAQEAEEHIIENSDDVSEAETSLLPRPPQLPRQLEKVILNSGVSKQAPINATAALVDDNSVLPAPNHAVLNHLATGAIKNGVLAMGTVIRFKNKYVTTVLYRPVHS